MKAIIRYSHTGCYTYPCAATLQIRDHLYSAFDLTWKEVQDAVILKAKIGEAAWWEVPPEEEVEI